MMINNLKLFSGITFSTLLATCFTTQAQKLPATQQGSLRAPANIKIDGKTTEWSNQLKAYNKATSLYYTLCNNNDNLYITIQAKDRLIIRKILTGGITFIANRSIKRDDKSIAITFPILAINLSNEISNYLDQRIGIASDKTGGIYQRDSLLLLMNTTLINSLKEIKVKGVKQFADTTLSVYNTAGIQAKALFDTDNAFTCELSVPVKYLSLLPETAITGFSYQLRVNNISANINLNNRELKPVMVTTIPRRSTGSIQSRLEAEQQILNNTTDFWGEYTMAK